MRRRPLTRIDPEEFESKVAGEIHDFKASDHMDAKAARKMAHFSQYAVAAANEAMQDSGLGADSIEAERLGTIIGNGIGGFEVLEDGFEKLFAQGAKRIPPMLIPKIISNEAPGNVAIVHNAQGPCYTITTACASATDAIGNAAHLIKLGKVDAVISGGTEGAITRMGIGGFCRLMALSTRFNDRPQEASRPFDKDRDGFIMAEGAGILILEELEHAKRRGAKIYGEIAGSGMTCDAHHLTSPHPEGTGAIRAMRQALAEAGMTPEDIDYINAHGTSTPVNDPVETRAIKAVFGEHAYKLKVSSTKGMTGHLVGAAGGVEAIISLLAIRDGFYPATINLDEADPQCDLNYVPNRGIAGPIRAAMSNSLGFGGHNGIVIFKQYEEN